MSVPEGPTFGARFHEMRPGLLWRLWRDLRCAGFLVAFAWRNPTLGCRSATNTSAEKPVMSHWSAAPFTPLVRSS